MAVEWTAPCRLRWHCSSQTT